MAKQLQLQFIEASADEEFLGSFAGIVASLISFCIMTKLPVYIRIAEELETLEDPDAGTRCSSMEGVREANDNMNALRAPMSEVETALATELVRGSRLVEVPGSYNPEKPDPTPEPITLPEPRLMSVYIIAPCKHECSVMKQIRHAKHARRGIVAINPIKQTLLRAKTGKCGLDSAYCHSATVRDVAKLDRPGGGDPEEGSREAALF